MNKKLIVFGIPLLLVLGLVSGVLLDSYGSWVTTIGVETPITIDGIQGKVGETIFTGISSGQEVLGGQINVENSDINERDIIVSSTLEDGITTSYVGVLDLVTKDTATWIDNGEMKATLYYTVIGNEFKYKVESENDLSNYIVVYYQDINEEKDWNIENAVNIGDVSNEWTVGNLDSNLPNEVDYNGNPNEGNSYCLLENGYDSYKHCSGAKIWLMPEVDLGLWNPNGWLFETDLIRYFQNGDNEMTITSEGSVEFYPLFDIEELVSGKNVITTTIEPTNEE